MPANYNPNVYTAPAVTPPSAPARGLVQNQMMAPAQPMSPNAGLRAPAGGRPASTPQRPVAGVGMRGQAPVPAQPGARPVLPAAAAQGQAQAAEARTMGQIDQARLAAAQAAPMRVR